MKSVIKNMTHELKLIYGEHFYFGNKIFALHQVLDEVNMVSQLEEQKFELTIKYADSFSMNQQTPDNIRNNMQVQCFVQNVIKKILFDEKYTQILGKTGRKSSFFLKTDMIPIQKYELEMWQGNIYSVKALQDGIFINVGTATKFINSPTILDVIKNLQKDNCTNQMIHDELIPNFNDEQRLEVSVNYNSRVFEVNDIKFDMSPKTHFFTWNLRDPITKEIIQQKTNIVDYMQIKYGIEIAEKDQDQPLLVVQQCSQTIYLIPSLCKKSTLSRSFLNDDRKMRDLQESNLNIPEQIYNRINTFIERVSKSSILNICGLKIDPQFTQVRAKQLPEPQIIDKSEKLLNWSSYYNRQVQHIQPIKLKLETWALVYANKDYEIANSLIDTMIIASQKFGILVESPLYVEIPKCDQQMYMDSITLDIDPLKTQIVVVILGTKTQKPRIKALLDKMGIPSQFILSDTLYKRSKSPFLCFNIIKQMNAKLKYDLYNLSLPSLRNTMVIGTNIYHTNFKSYLGLCASMNSRISQYYSKTFTLNSVKDERKSNKLKTMYEVETIITEQRSEVICTFIQEALINYQKENNGQLPEQIIIYRDGIGGLSFQEKLKNFEIQKVVNVIQSFQQGYNPMLIYCLVDRNVPHRLIYKSNDYYEYQNPSQGTVLDDALVEKQGDLIYDFFMIPHKAVFGTASLVLFKVAFNTSTMKKDEFELSTYHLCYNYVNFIGPIKCPAPCMYAKKIAQYSAENNVVPNEKLAFNLHYL
eukprot:403349409